MYHRDCLLATILLAILVAGCERETPADSAPPDTESHKSEASLAGITLSAQAAKSMGIKSEPLRSRKVQETLTLPGWVMVKPGNEVTVTAPLAGYIRAASAKAGLPIVGQRLEADQDLLVLEPVLTPIEQIQMASVKRDIENELAKARENARVADKELVRVQDLVRQKVKTEQELEQAQARARNAQADLAAAEDKRRLFAATGDGKDARLHPVVLRAPRGGTVMAVHASVGQYVGAAAPLVTIADLSELWLRVPVPERELGRLDAKRPASIGAPASAPVPVKPMLLIPQVDPAKHTADMLYALEPSQGITFAKDQMLTVHVPLGRERNETTVPPGALLYDSYGGAWIYVELEPEPDGDRRFERRRVEVGPRAGPEVVIHSSSKPGERAVVAGAAQLFSREFYAQPAATGGKKRVDDDDD